MKKLILIALVAFGFFTSCKNSNSDDLEDKMNDVTEEMKESWEIEKNDMQTSMEEMKMKLDAKINDIDAKMKDASDDMKKELEAQKLKAQTTKEELDAKMNELKNSAADNWADFKADVQNWKQEHLDI